MNLLVEQMNDLRNHQDGFPDEIAIWRNIENLDVRGTNRHGNTQLHLVLYNLKLDENVVKELLDLGAPVNAANYSGRTPLHYALLYQNGELPIVTLLVSREANVNQSDNGGFGPLVFALWNENCSTDVIKFLCDKGADVKIVDESGSTLLHQASKNRKLSLEVFKMLLDKEVSAHKVNMHGETALHVAVRYSRKDVVELLLNVPKIKVNLVDKLRYTPLHLAVSDPTIDPGIIKLLLEAGAIINKKTNLDRQCLHLAAQYCNPTHIKILLDYEARVNVLDTNKLSPLDIAVNKSQHCDIIALKLLLGAGALIFHDKPKKKMNPQDKYSIDTTALHVAVRDFNIESKTQQILLLLKYAALENSHINVQNMQTDCKNKRMLTAYYQKCMEELKTVCIVPKVTLAQFILRSRLQENRVCPTRDILEILSAHPYPIYKEVVAGLMNRDDLSNGLQQHPFYALNKNKPDERIVLDYDTLCGVMIYLSDDDLLNLLLAVYEPKRSPVRQVKRVCDCGMCDEIEEEFDRFRKRARIV